MTLTDFSVQPIHVIVISSVRPELTSAGQIILYRHLVNQPGITLEVCGTEPQGPTLSRLIRRIAGRLGKTRLHRFIEDFWVLWSGRWMDPELPQIIAAPERTIVLTVAHGDGFMAAKRFAHRHQLPLVSIFHDWWPDMVEAHGPAKQLADEKFRELARQSAISLCVCEGMRKALGTLANSAILPPLSAELAPVETPANVPGAPYKILYSGNLFDYGPMLGDALEESLKHPETLLQVRGANPAWSGERKAKMRANGRWLDFAPRAELDAWLASADAFLIPMVFAPAMRRRMETSFPSKLIEFAQFGKPLIIWGPEYCSAVQWARQGDKALCVTDSDPRSVVQCLLKIRSNPDRIVTYAEKAKQAAIEEFNPHEIQRRFREVIHSLDVPRNPSFETM